MKNFIGCIGLVATTRVVVHDVCVTRVVVDEVIQRYMLADVVQRKNEWLTLVYNDGSA